MSDQCKHHGFWTTGDCGDVTCDVHGGKALPRGRPVYATEYQDIVGDTPTDRLGPSVEEVPPPPPLISASDCDIEDDPGRRAYYGGADNPYEAIKVINAWDLNFCLGNAVKYIARAGKKPGAERLDDLEKAIWYLQQEIWKESP